MTLKISIVIATRNRSRSLNVLFHSVLCQTILPDEVIVVDDSDDNETLRLVKAKRDVFFKKGIMLRYLRGKDNNRNSSCARNIGTAASTGDIVFSFDDDIVIDRQYIKEILTTYEEYPAAKGVQGYIVNGGTIADTKCLLLNSVNKVFFMDHFEKSKCFYKLGLTYPYSPEGVIQCNYLHGTNTTLKKEIASSFSYDEKLVRRSIGEDIDLSFRVFKRYPNSLFLNSKAKLSHLSTTKPNKLAVFLDSFYFVYLFFKNYDQTIVNKLTFVWSMLGRLFVNTCKLIFISKDFNLAFCTVKSYFYVAKNLQAIKKGDFRFLDPILH